jgi:hypothetical protein
MGLRVAINGAKSGDDVSVVLPWKATGSGWSFFCVATDLSAMNAAVSVGIWNNTDISWIGTQEVYIDSICAAVPFTGNPQDLFQTCIATDTAMFTNGGRVLVATNNADDLVAIESVNNVGSATIPATRFATLVHTISGYVTCNTIIEFWNHFFVMNYKTASLVVMNLSYSGAGNLDDWTSSVSGTHTLFDSLGPIRRATLQDDTLVIYSSKSITLGRYYGEGTLFAFPTINKKLGIHNNNSLVETSLGDFFVGSDERLYHYKVGQLPIDIGTVIDKTFFDSITTPGTLRSLVADYGEQKRIMFSVPVGPNGSTNLYALNLKSPNRPWEYYEFATSPLAWSRIDESVTALSSNIGQSVFIDENSDVFVVDEPGNFNGTAITCEYQTQDISIDDEFNFA